MSADVVAPPKRRVSASALNTLRECSLRYWYNYVLKVPQTNHPKATLGSLIHSIFECLRNPRHKDQYDLITRAPFDYTRSPAFVRLVRAWRVKHQLADNLFDPFNSLLEVGLMQTNFFHEGAIRVFEPEHEFTLLLGGGADQSVVKGFIDSMGEYPDEFLIYDYKSAGQKYTKAEVPTLIQALVYQLYVWKTFRKRARVQFIMLRHAPTARAPDKHIQECPPLSEAQLGGLEMYLADMFKVMNDFGLEEALSNPSQDQFFCSNICPFLRPQSYYAIVKKGDATQTPLKTFPLDKPPQSWYPDEVLIRLQHQGCAARWNANQSSE